MRIALFGGTFDPPHRGHRAIATAAADAFHLDRILFAPTGLQPLKTTLPPAPYQDRLAMVALAIQQDPRFSTSTLDAPHLTGLPNYTVDTLTTLRQLYPDDTLFNLVGADSFLTLPKWRDSGRLLDLADWIVVSRPGSPLPEPLPFPLKPQQITRVHRLETVHLDISSTDLRHRLHQGDPCSDILPPGVSDYIRQHHLYQT